METQIHIPIINHQQTDNESLGNIREIICNTFFKDNLKLQVVPYNPTFEDQFVLKRKLILVARNILNEISTKNLLSYVKNKIDPIIEKKEFNDDITIIEWIYLRNGIEHNIDLILQIAINFDKSILKIKSQLEDEGYNISKYNKNELLSLINY